MFQTIEVQLYKQKAKQTPIYFSAWVETNL